ncbi:MAG: 4Fe-4S dicluster domain-containing protein [Deltaproteobacteria bacterium]|nr:4Fe-4S dicluster domain-containing protein [Deltaproteobacteria bacterium]
MPENNSKPSENANGVTEAEPQTEPEMAPSSAADKDVEGSTTVTVEEKGDPPTGGKTAETVAAEERVRDILVSNLDMRRLIELDACTRCGECLTWCPVYDQDEKMGIIPRAKVTDFLRVIRAQKGLLGSIIRNEKTPEAFKKLLAFFFRYKDISKNDFEVFVKNLYECSTCGQCHVVCPAHIDTVNLWEDIRRLIVKADYGPLESQKALIKSVKSYDNPWQQPRAGRTKWARRAKKEKLIQELPREIKKTSGKVLLFLGCTAAYDINVKQVAVSTINILEALDVDYGCLGKDEKCCGSVMLRMGDPEFERLASENIKMFNELGIETLISSCAGCFKTIKGDYPKVAKMNFEVLHTVEFLRRLYEDKRLIFKNPVEKCVTYHDPCHLGRASGVYDDPRFIMDMIPGLELIEMPRTREYSRCCGAGGGLKSGYPDIQNKMAQRRVKEAEATGAEELVSACPFCYQGLQVGISALESPLVMRDISFLVEASLQDESRSSGTPKKERKVRKVRKPRAVPSDDPESGEK